MDKVRHGIFYNASSGTGQAATVAKTVADQLKSIDIDSLIVSGHSVSSAIDQLRAIFAQIQTLIVIGGDGTINVAATALLQTSKKIKLGIVPAGTINNFAQRYHIPIDLTEAISLVCSPEKQSFRKAGLLICNQNRAVVSSLTFGNLADISNEVRQQEKRRFGKIIYAWKALQHIGKNRSFKIRYQLDDGTDQTLKTWFALITTTKSIGGHTYSQSTPNKMHISLLNNIGFKQVLPYLFFALTGNLQSSKSIRQTQATQAIITNVDKKPVQTRIDGDQAVKLPIRLQYLPNFLHLIIQTRE